MNLTKRMMQIVACCVGACAFTAVATDYVSDSFENESGTDYNYTNGLGIVYYKATKDVGTGIPSVTNWFTAEGDASALLTGDALNQNYSLVTRPLSGVLSNLVLNLSTEGQTLSRTVNGGPITFTTTPVWVDTMIKFTASEDAPASSDLTDAKVAVYVDANSHLMIYHGAEASPYTATADLGAISTNDWHRLTIYMGKHPKEDLAFAAFKVLVDGVVQVSSEAYNDNGDLGGSWFLSAVSGNAQISSVAFKGTGLVDELRVTDQAVSFSSAVQLTLSFPSDKVSVVCDSVSVSDGGTVTAGKTIIIDAIDWYQIQSVTGTGDAAYAGPVGTQVNCSTGIVSATAAASLTIGVTNYTGTITSGSVTIDAAKMSAWALANGKSEAAVIAAGAGWYDDYLCNVAPDTNPQLQILSIVVNQTTSIATVTVGTTGNAVNFGTLNGTLKVTTRDDLGTGAWGTAFEGVVTINSPATTATIDIDISSAGAGYFIRAVIQ